MKSEYLDVGAKSKPTIGAPPPEWWQAMLIGVWIVGLVVGLAVLWRYKETPGAAAITHTNWPASSHLRLGRDVPTLVMFAHPRCVCTRASLANLRALLSPFPGKVNVIVAFMRPRESGHEWAHTDTWADASSIPGVRAVEDIDGQEAALFGARTSGQIMLYNPGGLLAFSGGLTPARGHVGDSEAMRQLAGLITGAAGGSATLASATGNSAPVYGCKLQGGRR